MSPVLLKGTTSTSILNSVGKALSSHSYPVQAIVIKCLPYNYITKRLQRMSEFKAIQGTLFSCQESTIVAEQTHHAAAFK